MKIKKTIIYIVGLFSTLFICNGFSDLYAYVFDMTLHDAKLEMLWSIACGCLWACIYFLWFYNDYRVKSH